MMLTPIQEILLHCLFIAPEDKKGFKKLQHEVRAKRWYSVNRELTIKRQKTRVSNFPDQIREYKKTWMQTQRAKNPEYNLRKNLSFRIWATVKRGHKSASTLELLGCTLPELRAHLEKQFRPGMTWENYGPVWHVDHRKPCASFDLTQPEQQRECFHFSNLQPLFAVENLSKGASITS